MERQACLVAAIKTVLNAKWLLQRQEDDSFLLLLILLLRTSS